MKYFIVDAFTDTHFKGNPAGVCLLDSPLDSAILQDIATENNLAETAFLLKEKDSYRLRWFTPEQEFDLCGHATLASAYVLFHFVEKDARVLHFNTQSGPLYVERKGDLLEMDFPARPPKSIPVIPLMEEALGVPVLEAWLSRDMVVMVGSENEVASLTPDLNIVEKIPDCDNLIVTAKGQSADFVSRYFTPGIAIPEDPVTGSAHSTLIPFWAERLGKDKMIARQLSKRSGVIYCENLESRVKISGHGVLYLSGELHL